MLQNVLLIQVLKFLETILKMEWLLRLSEHRNQLANQEHGLINLIIGQVYNGQKGLGYIIFEGKEFKGPIANNLNEKLKPNNESH